MKTEDDSTRLCDPWTSLSIDADTKLIPAYCVGNRTWTDASIRTSMRLANRVQLSTHGLSAYADAVERAFGAEVDYGQAVKFYEAEPLGQAATARCTSSTWNGRNRTRPISRPASSSGINLTMRMSMRRFTPV